MPFTSVLMMWCALCGRRCAEVNTAIAAGQVWRLFTPMLLHGSELHLILNCMGLYNVGPVVEDQLGSKQFLLLYLGSGFAGNLLSFKMNPKNMVGASGAIFGLVGAMGVYLMRHQELLGAQGERQLKGLGRAV